MRSRFSTRNGGFSLLETAVAIAVLGILTGGILQLAAIFTENQAYDTTEERMQAVREALVLHAAREGFLPCPADATASPSEAGVAQPEDADQATCADSRSIVGVPWQTLGIPRSTTFDGWGYRLSYAVFDGETGVTRGETSNEEGLDMLTCSCPGPNCTRDAPPEEGDADYKLENCIPGSEPEDTKDYVTAFLRDKGLTVLTDADDDTTAFMDPSDGTGAAFVLISHGPNAAGAYGQAALVSFPDDGSSNEEANAEFGDDTFVDAQGSNVAGTAYDDIVLAERIDAVAKEAGWFLRD